MATKVLEEVTNGHVRVLRLNRPERKNALTQALGWEVINGVRRAEDVAPYHNSFI